jgi:hypothetical protein
MIPNEVVAAWIVGASTAASALGGLSLLDKGPSTRGMEAEPLPFYYADVSTSQRLPPLDRNWRSHFETTGSLPSRPTVSLTDLGDDEVDEIAQRDMMDEPAEDPLATISGLEGFMGP